MKVIFQIDGGMGKCIASTAVCKAIKTQYPNDELIVISGYPDVFLCNPNVSLNLGFPPLLVFPALQPGHQQPRAGQTRWIN